ncbi:MAG: 50S ribosomal protein L4 [Crenarchaeota archaeon]|nr:50S ribosomal protein L4 [Thermoproteota archaeon]MDW8033814.1 50S ribosomal protein L4 [Nitrososphaerota archaeon]
MMSIQEELKIRLLKADGEEDGEASLPSFLMAFEVEDYLIRRAFLAQQSRRLQPQGRDPMAGKRTTAESWGVGYGIARVPRTERGVARFAPMTVKGRLAHPPRVEKKIRKNINKKEYRKAFLSALSATFNREIVKKRGHRLGEVKIPIVFTQDIENLSKTREVIRLLEKIGLDKELERIYGRPKIRGGKSKWRGRRLRRRVGPLIIVSSMKASIVKSASGIPGVDVKTPNRVSVMDLAPGGHPGRLTIWSLPALNKMVERVRKYVAG